ncbi:aldo/keto reductase [Magnetofaba australis]|nr:aldo/keto reductase [Magnetofaba australis]
MKRRDFLKSTALAGAVGATAGTSAALGGAASAQAAVTGIQKYGTLGKTGLKMSDISFGGGHLPSGSMLLRAMDQGINYIDTAPDYGASESHIGEAMPRIQRDKLIIATKFCRQGAYPGHLPLGTKKAEYIAMVEESLQRMKTDYTDLLFVHAMGEKNDLEGERKRLLDPEMLAAFAVLKQAGKARFLAVSSHGPYNMETLMLEAVNSGHYDVIMPAFNFMKFPRISEVMKTAHSKGIGVVAMKTLAGAKGANLKEPGPFEHAAFKWVLKHPEVAGLVVTIKSRRDLNLYVGASGQAFSAADQRHLDQYAALYGREYCRTGCSDCEASCPAGVPVGHILRYRMYFEDYGQEKQGMAQYAQLETNAEACVACDGQACNAACPHGLPVGGMAAAAHRMLTLA